MHGWQTNAHVARLMEKCEKSQREHDKKAKENTQLKGVMKKNDADRKAAESEMYAALADCCLLLAAGCLLLAGGSACPTLTCLH